MPDFSFIGPKWPLGPVTWAFAGTTYASDARRPFSSSISSGPAQAEVAEAVQKWASVSGLDLRQVPDRASPANAPNIRIGYGRFDTATTRIMGETSVPLGPTLRSGVVVRLEDPAQLPTDNVGADIVYRGTGVTLYQLALHEFGHALGLDHSANLGSNLYPSIGSNNRDLGAPDVLGIRALYPAPSVKLRGPQSDYVIASVSGGQAYIQDKVAGRDNVQVMAKLGRISFSDGSALFDAGDTTAEVTRLYRGAFGRAPDLQGLEDNAALVSTRTIGINALAASFTAAPEFISRYGQTDTVAFVQQLYRNVLGREADADGQQNWINVVNATSRGDALLAFSDSQESHRLTLPITGSRNDAAATRLYQAAFDRAPDAPGLSLWSGALKQGMSLEQVAQGFIGSQEFAGRYGALDADGFVTQLYANVLHRAPDAPGKQGWLNELAGGSSRAKVLAGFADSNENRIATAGATHDAWVSVR